MFSTVKKNLYFKGEILCDVKAKDIKQHLLRIRFDLPI